MKKKINNKNKKNTPYYIWGLHASLEAISNQNRIIKKIFCSQRIFDNVLSKNLVPEIHINILKKQDLDSILEDKVVHQGIIIETKPLTYPTFDNILEKENLIIALDQVTDPQNVGAIIRSVKFFGGKTILITKDHSAEINGALAKSASGALEYIDIIKVTNLSMSLNNLKKKGFIIIGLDENSDVLLNNLNNYKNSKIVLVFGSEGKGLRRLTKERCDLLISINNNNDGNFTTLNVSTAAAVTLYELLDKNI